MNEDSRDSSVMSGALQLVGAGTAIAYGHKGLNKLAGSDMMAKYRNDPDSIRGMMANGYQKINPMIDSGKNKVKGWFSKNPTLENTPTKQNSTMSDLVKQAQTKTKPNPVATETPISNKPDAQQVARNEKLANKQAANQRKANKKLNNKLTKNNSGGTSMAQRAMKVARKLK